LFQQNRWIEMFPCIIARASTNEVISNGINGTRNGALQLVCQSYHVVFYHFAKYRL
jgi:homeobox-leucine zipper protein